MQVFVKLAGVVTESYDELDSQAKISANMEPLIDFTDQMPFLESGLTNVEANVTDLDSSVSQLEIRLNVVKIVTIQKISCSVPDCLDMIDQVNNTVVTADYTSLPGSFQNFIILLQAITNDLNGTLNDGYSEFKNVVNEVNQTVSDDINSARNASQEVAVEISQELQNIERELNSIDFNGSAQNFEELQDDMKDPADYALYGMTGIAGLLLIIVLFGFLGLLFGCLCPQAKPGKGDACCTKKIGATCLLAGVGFTFIFFWILMILLIALMLTGGLLHTELCRHLVDLDQSPVMSIIDDLMNDTLYNDVGFSINISEIYSSCKNNEAFYTALNVEETFGFDLNTILDTSAIETEIDNIRNTPIDIGSVNLLPGDAVSLLNGLGRGVENTKVNVETAMFALNKNVTNEDLGDLADELQILNDDQGLNLQNEINTLRGLHNDVIDISNQKQTTYDELDEIHNVLSGTDITALTIGLQEGNTTVNTNGSAIIENVIDETADNVDTIINEGVSAINHSVRFEVGKCAPIYNAYATIIDAGCVELLYPVNGYWFSLGWSLFFLIIGVIMSFKLATLYRRTYRDRNAVYPDVGYDKVRLAVISSGN